jgi:hypothetical protein
LHEGDRVGRDAFDEHLEFVGQSEQEAVDVLAGRRAERHTTRSYPPPEDHSLRSYLLVSVCRKSGSGWASKFEVVVTERPWGKMVGTLNH